VSDDHEDDFDDFDFAAALRRMNERPDPRSQRYERYWRPEPLSEQEEDDIFAYALEQWRAGRSDFIVAELKRHTDLGEEGLPLRNVKQLIEFFSAGRYIAKPLRKKGRPKKKRWHYFIPIQENEKTIALARAAVRYRRISDDMGSDIYRKSAELIERAADEFGVSSDDLDNFLRSSSPARPKMRARPKLRAK